jgi:hypothetical protein
MLAILTLLSECQSEPKSGLGVVTGAVDASAEAGEDVGAPEGGDGSPHCCPIGDVGGCKQLGGEGQDDACAPSCDFYCTVNWRVERDPAGCDVWLYDTRAPAPGEDKYCSWLPEAGEGGGGEGGGGPD